MDVHLHTGANLRRYLLKLEGVSLRNKLLALLTWHTGPEVRSTQNRMEPPPQPNPDAVAALPHRSQAALLDALQESIYTQPPTDWSKVTSSSTRSIAAAVALRHRRRDLARIPGQRGMTGKIIREGADAL